MTSLPSASKPSIIVRCLAVYSLVLAGLCWLVVLHDYYDGSGNHWAGFGTALDRALYQSSSMVFALATLPISVAGLAYTQRALAGKGWREVWWMVAALVLCGLSYQALLLVTLD